MSETYSYLFRTPLGSFRLTATRRGLYSLDFHRKTPKKKGKIPRPVRLLLERGASAIRAYLGGGRADFTRLPVDWSGYSELQKKVLGKLQKIPWGEVRSYEFLARQAGRPRAARYVGQVLRMNRLPLILPCHRIVRKTGELGGYSGGISRKRRLLKLEGGSVDNFDREFEGVILQNEATH